MDESFQFAVFCICLTVLSLALFWLLLPRTVVEIPGADAEDRHDLALLVQPKFCEEILRDTNLIFSNVYHVDSIIRALAKRGHVIIGPSREDIEQAASLLEGRIIP